MRVLHTDFVPDWAMVHKQALYRDNPSSMPIVMAGDSLTDYGDWPELLHRLDVGNRGITGDTSAGLLERAGMLATDGAIVAVMIGENDLAEHRSVSEVCSNIAGLVDRLRTRHPVLLEATLLTGSSVLNKQIADLDVCERRVCESSKGCTYLDLNPELAPGGALAADLTFDGFHLNQAGYARWAKVLGPVLEKAAR